MATIPTPILDYTDRDFVSLKARLDELVVSVYPQLDPDAVGATSTLLLELFSFVGDVLAYYQDNQAQQSRIVTATLRKVVLDLVKPYPFVPRGATASRTDVVISLVDPPPGVVDVIVPAETVVRTQSVVTPVQYRTLEAALIAEGETSVTVTAENSEPAEDFFSSTNLPNQAHTLSKTPYLDGSAVVVASNGTFTQVTDFFDSTSTDRHYTLSVDDSDRATLTFGNGVNGLVPNGTITVIYRVGGGADGQVDAESITRIDGTFTDINGAAVTLSVTNPARSTVAQDRQSLAEIKREAPRSLRVLTRTVSREDFEIGAEEIPGVARALMLTSNELPGTEENTGQLYVVPEGGGVAPQATLDEVLEAVTVTRPSTLTFRVDVISAPVLPVAISAVVHLVDGADPAQAKADVLANLASYFNPAPSATREAAGLPQVNFGYYLAESAGTSEPAIPWSDIHGEIVRAAGIRKIDDRDDGLLINGAREDLDVALNQFPTLDPNDVTLINVATGLPL